MINYYDILGISSTSSESEIKSAFKRKLLANHPDKSKNTTVAVNLIQEAYQVLVNPHTRSKYDGELHTNIKFQGIDIKGDGLDIYNLSDFDCVNDTFHKDCPRCHSIQSIQFTEQDLMNGSQTDDKEYEIIVQCGDCSLWITVQYEEDD